MLPSHLLKSIHWTLAVAMLAQPILAAVPPEVVRAAPAEVAPQTAGPAHAVVAAPVEPLTATVPALYPAPHAAPMVTQAQVEETLHSAPIMFIEGETQPSVSAQGKERPAKTFQVQGANGSIWLAPDAIWVTLHEPPAEKTMEEHLLRGPERMEAIEARAKEPIEAVNLKISFVGANLNPRIEGFDPLDTTFSYFKGNDPEEWRANVPVWGGVRYVDLYPGIDLVVASKDGAWDWRLEVADTSSMASLKQVALRVEGAQKTAFDGPGKSALDVQTQIGAFKLPLLKVKSNGRGQSTTSLPDNILPKLFAPFTSSWASSERLPNSQISNTLSQMIAGWAPAVQGNAIAHPFVLTPVDAPQLDIVSHPDIAYSTFVSGTGYEWPEGIAVDANGEAYITGYARSWYGLIPPEIPGYQKEYAGGFYDAFVVKLSADGSSLLYASYLGGSSEDLGRDIAVDGDGAALVIGTTQSADLVPDEIPGPDKTLGGDNDGFVAKLSTDGSALLYATYVGGSSGDGVYDIVVDEAGDIYISGGTGSSDLLPEGISGYDNTLGGSHDAFIAKLSGIDGSWLYGTYFGGSSSDGGGFIALDESGSVFVAGRSASTDLIPENVPGYDKTLDDLLLAEMFAAKLDIDSNSLLCATYLGGSGSDYVEGIAVDENGAAYVIGDTNSTDMIPDDVPGYDKTFNGSSSSSGDDGFAIKLSADGTQLAYATYLGGSDEDNAYGIEVDNSGVAYIIGFTWSSDMFPDDIPGYDKSHNSVGYYDVFVTLLSADGDSLLYGSYLGSTLYDEGTGIALDGSGAVYLTGYTTSMDFPVTSGAYQTSGDGGYGDAFVTKLHIPIANPDTWTWVSGSDVADQPGVYGTKGVASPNNMPGARRESISWMDTADNLWLFGGIGYDSTGSLGWLNDLWKYDGTNWIWVSGSNVRNQSGVYGTKGVASPSNMPGARESSVPWTDTEGNLWLFGGIGYDSVGLAARLNDLWKYDGTNWTWVSGSNIDNQTGVYGTKGVADPNNVPGARHSSVSWTDAEGNLWLFGGDGYEYHDVMLNDLWKFDGTNWTWVSGSDIINQPGVYGTKGVASPSNVPGARYLSVSWTDTEGNLWLFGGVGRDSANSPGYLNDLWKYDGANWTWVSGSDIINQPGVYGTKGVASPSNVPGARHSSVSWTDAEGNLWLFGGVGRDSANSPGSLNDLWKYDGANWIWVSGSDIINQPGVYGTKGVADPNNVPGARHSSVSWMDVEGNLWLFGGDRDTYHLNDLWKYGGVQPALPPVPDAAVAGASGAPGCSGCPAENYAPATQSGTGGSINTRTGNEALSSTDLSLPTQAGSIAFNRSYSTFNARDEAADLLPDGPMGVGWTHNTNVYLIRPTDPGGEPNRLLMHLAEGSRIGFTDQGSGVYTTDAGAGGTLTREGTGGSYTYTYTNSQDVKYIFRNDGKLTALDNGRGQQLNLTYDGSGRLTRVAEPGESRYLDFSYTDGRLTGVIDSAGRGIAYGYTDGNLTSFTDVRGKVWTYQYADARFPNFVTARLDPLGQAIMSYEYDDQGRAFRETNSAGQVMVELAFNADETTTVIRGEDGVGGEQTHEYDARYTLTDQSTTAGGSTTHYDPNFRPDQVTDANDNPTVLEWSADGSSLTGVTDALGNPTGFAYDDRHHLTLVTNADGSQTYFVYNTDGATNPLTGAPIANSAWDEDLLLMQIDNYVPLETGVNANLVTRYFYTVDNDPDEPANLVKRVEAPGGNTCYAYNAFGQQTQVTQDCGGAHPITTSSTYDTAGRLETTTDALGKVTRYVYTDGDDRADEVISNYDGSDPVNYYASDGLYNLSTRTFLDALGRTVATVSNYNPGTIEGGEDQTFTFGGENITLQISTTHPEYNQVSTTHYDAAGRVDETISNYWPNKEPYYLNKYNVSTRTYYDGAGRVVATVNNYHADPPGSGTAQPMNFDTDAEVEATIEISTEAPEFNQISLTVYDSAGRVSRTASNYDGSDLSVPANLYKDGVYNFVSATEYDAAGNVLKSITNFDPGVTTGYAFDLDLVPDAEGQKETPLHVDPDMPDRNQITCTEYDALNRPVFTRTACVPPPEGEEYSDYLENGDNLYNIVSATYYDEMGRQIASVRNYEDNGVSSTDGILELTETRNFITRTYYDGLGRAEYVVENSAGDIANPVPSAHVPVYPNHNLVTRFYYDTQGRQVAVARNYLDPTSGDSLTQSDILNGDPGDAGEDPEFNLVSYTHYDASGRVDYTLENFVGDLGDLIEPGFTPSAFDPDRPDQNLLTRYSYDATGRRYETAIDRNGQQRVTHSEFDDLGRAAATIANYIDGDFDPDYPDQDVTTVYDYQALGRITETTDPAGNVRRSISELLDTVNNQRTSVSITDPSGLALTSTSISNAAGQTARTIDASGRATETTFDAQGRAVETTTDPEGLALTTSTTYDLLRRAVTSTDAQGIVTRYQYDNLGRLRVVFENYVSGQTDSTWGGCLYDDDGINVCTRYDYDDTGNLESTVLGNGSGTVYEYDARGQMTQEMVDPGVTNIVTAYTYDAAGNQVTLTRDPNGTPQVTTTSYDRLGRTTHIDYEGDDLDVDYSYDAWGNRATMLDAGGTWHYTYDAMNHLTSVTDPDDVEVAYTYDPTGNRASLTAPGMDVDYIYDPAGRLDTVSNPFGAGVVDYGYAGADLDGATLPNGTSTTNIYDSAGRLKQILNQAGLEDLSTFLYSLDDRGNRTDAAETLDTPGALAAPAAAPTQPVDPTPELPVPGPEMTATLPADPTSEPPTAEVETTTPQPFTPEPATSEPVEDTNTLFSGTNPLVMPAVSAPIDQAVSSNRAAPQNEALLQSTPPIAPSSLVVTTDGPTQLTISWQDNSEDETGFLLEWSTDSGSTWTQLADQTIASFAHTPLLCQTTHTYRVRAYNTAGSSDWATGSGMTGSCQPGMLDATFGEDGIVTTGSEEQPGEIFAVALQPDGKIVAAGYVIASGGGWDVALARYNPDGSLDPSFGAGGIATNDLGSQWEEIHALALQPDGKIVAAVYDGSHAMVARYNADGSLDASFAVGGIVTAGLDSIAVASVALQPDGKIVVAGGLNSVHGAALARYNADGSPDTTFGTNGVVNTQIADRGNVTSMGIQPDGKIVAGGWMYSSDYNQKFVLYRYLSDGVLDTGFGTDGIVITDFGLDTDEIGAIAFQPDGKIVAAGRSQSGSAENTNYDFALARYFSDGSLDTSFGAGGKLVTDLGTPYDGAEAVVVQNDGKIIAVGSSWGGDAPPSFALVRYTDNGSLDTSFSDDGVLNTPVGLESGGSAYAAVLQPDGKLIAAGTARYNFTLVRYYTTTSLTAPTDLTTTPSAQAQIDLAWTDNSSDETGFRIERSPDGAGEWTEIGSTEADIAAYQDSTLVCDTAYSYRVRAYRAGDGVYSDYSNIVSASTAACQAVLTIAGGPLDFGGQDINTTSAPQTLTLTNSGGADLTIDSITVSGEFALVESGSCPSGASTLVVGASCTADVVFSPTSASAKTGQLTVASSAPGPQIIDLSGTGMAPAAPSTPVLVSPAAGLLSTNSIPTFTWNASTNGYQYQIQVDNSGTSFPSPEINVTAAATAFTADTALADGAYSWRVRAINSVGVASAWSAVRALTIDTTPPAAPALSAPADDIHVSGTPTYSWAAASTATAYQFEYDDNADFSSPVYTSPDTLTAVTHTPPTQDPGTYYWHVRARDAAGNWSVWSAARTVTIVPLTPAAPTPTGPANAAQTNDNTPTFTWNAVTYGARYQIQVDDGGSTFPSPEVNVTTGDLSYTPTEPLADGTYTWRLRTQNVYGVWGAWGPATPWTVMVDTVAPAAPALTTPADAAIVKTARPALALTAVTGATQYHRQVSDTSDFSSLLVDVTGTATSYTLTAAEALAYGGTFYWRAQAGDAAGNWGEWSEVRSFTINMMTAPADGSSTTDTTPPFSWTSVSGATYTLQVDNDSDFSSPLLNTPVATYAYTPTTALSYGTFYWRLQVLVGGVPSGGWMGPWSFIVTTAALAAPVPVSPATGFQTNDTTPELTWNAVANAAAYQIQMDNNGSTFPSPEVDATTADLSYSPTGPLADGTYTWRLRTQNVYGVWGAWGPATPRTVIVDTIPPAAPALSAPADAAIVKTARPALALTAVTGATQYRRQVSDTPDFSSPLVDVTGTATSYTLTGAEALAYGGTFYWRAQAGDAAGNWGEWSEVRSFTINMMTAPADGSSTTDTTPPFSWTAVSGATYTLQVDDDADFSSPLLNTPVATYAYTPTTALSYGTFYWRLQVLVGGVPSGGWMGPWSFIVTTAALAAPVPVSPATGFQTNDATPELTWNAVANAAAYQIQMDNNGSTFPGPEVDATTADLSYSPTGPLADGTYTWRLRTQNAYGVWGAWGPATPRTVIVDTVAPAAPALTTPADAAIVKTARPALALTAVTGATQYRRQVSDTSDFSSPLVDVTGTATSYTLTAAEALAYGGTFYWRAQAGDAAGNWGEWSEVRSFTINMMTAPADGSSTTDTTPSFSWTSVSGATYTLQVDNDADFSSPLLNTPVATYAYTPTTALPYGTLYWRLQVLVGGVPSGGWMGPWLFIVTTAALAAPVPVSPATGFQTNDTTPELTWNAVANAAAYQIQMDNNGSTFPSPEVDATTADLSYSPTGPLADGTYTWRLRTQNVYGVWGAWGPATPWTVIVDTVPPAAPALTAPVNYAAVVGTPAYSWAASSTATAYRFQSDTSADFSSPDLYTSEPQAARTLTPPTQPPGDIYWHVQARDAAGNWSDWSVAWTVSIAPAVPAAPVLVSPANAATTFDNTPDLVWSPVAYGATYQVQVDNSGTAFPSPEQNVIVAGTTLTTIELPNATYTWRVRAINSLGQRGAWSASRTFTVNATPPPAPTLISPADGLLVYSATLEFTWNTVTGGERYQIQISDEDSFASPWQDQTLEAGVTTYTAAALLSGTYFWRVRALNEWGVTGAWSVVRSFTVNTDEMSYIWHYDYDGLSRVIYACSYWTGTACAPTGHEFHYAYDGAGNLLRFDKWNSTTNQVETVRYGINGANQIACLDDASADGKCDDGETLWQYDAYGNLKSDGTTTYTYDKANRVSSITANSVTTTYKYNGDGDRIEQKVGEVTTTYVLDTATPLTMVLSETTGAETITYWHGLDTLAQSDGTTTEYFSYDGLGSVRQLVDATGSVGLAQTFDPYGNGYAKAGSAQSALGYSGEQTDSNGFVYLRARYYHMGRFTQMDPSRQERNAYQYAAGNPIMFVDPSGLLVTCSPWRELPEKCADKILSEYQGLTALVQLFVNRELNKYGAGTGETAEERLGWIIYFTMAKEVGGFFFQGKNINDVGVHPDFRDFSDDQLGRHFMQGVRFGFDRSLIFTAGIRGYTGDSSSSFEDVAFKMMIEHETFVAFDDLTENDVNDFRNALFCDAAGNRDGREDALEAIFDRWSIPYEGNDDGRSMVDMRLWVKGYRFGAAVRTGEDNWSGSPAKVLKTRYDAASWLLNNLGQPLRMRGGR